jgi:acyl-[acyl-carrier-protein] desaturase
MILGDFSSDTITEEALPTYESWLMDVEGIDNVERNGWSKWIRQWTSEENRHGDLLNKYLYLSGRVNMRVEMTTQHLISDGFDIGTGRDPIKISSIQVFRSLRHMFLIIEWPKWLRNMEIILSKMCKMIAGDEMRHHHAYSEFVSAIFKVDPNDDCFSIHDETKNCNASAFSERIRRKISTAFEQFSDSAQRIGVYTAADYIDIMQN